MATARALLLLITMSWMHAIADPRCLVRTMYQAQPVVFLCYGSGDSGCNGNSKACNEPVTTVAIHGGNALELFDIPVGTKDFQMSFKNVNGNFHVWDPTIKTYLLDDTIIKGLPKKSSVGEQNFVKEYQGVAAGVNFTFQELTGPGFSKQSIHFQGKTKTPITLRLENPSTLEKVYRLRYHYAPYDEGSQCKFGGHGVGCKPYYQQGARTLAVQYAEWLHKTYTNAEGAWHYLSVTALHSGAGQGRRLLTQNGINIPSYRWCELYVKWPDAINTDCQKVYKFITHGGLEANTVTVERENFDFLWKLPYLHQFADGCCRKLTFLFQSYSAFLAADNKAKNQNNVGDRVWNQCQHVQPTPKKAVYMSYLDADGYQGFLPDDIKYCWDPRSAATKKVCTWNLAAGCVGQFTFQGTTVTGCTTGDRLSVWCSMDAQYAGKWRLCTSVCTEVAAPGCHWTKDADCVASFAYKGVTYNNGQCATVDHYQGWCSTTSEYTTFSKDWRHCDWVCPAGTLTTTTWAEASKTTSVAAPNSCPANSDTTKCFVNGGADTGCCAKQGAGTCASGFIYNRGGLCQSPDLYKTCCISQALTTTIGVTTSTAAPECVWALVTGCVANFSLGGQTREGCVVDHPEVSATPWCSLANPYVGTFKPCVRVCGGTTAIMTTSHNINAGAIALGVGGAAAGAGVLAAGIYHVIQANQHTSRPNVLAPSPTVPPMTDPMTRPKAGGLPSWVAPVCFGFFCLALAVAAISLICACSRRKSRGRAYPQEDGYPLMYDDGYE